MNDWNFVGLVKELRKAQKKYNDERSQANLEKARDLGSQVDRAIEEYEARGQSLYDYEG